MTRSLIQPMRGQIADPFTKNQDVTSSKKVASRGRTGIAMGLALCAALCASAVVQAQGVYRIVGPDGKVSFSDQPPPDAKAAAKLNVGGGSSAAANRASLPFELQQVASKYPVTLYTSSACGPCDNGRALLTSRGVPYTEKTVNTNEDIAAFGRVTKDNSLPLLTIGGQQVKGFSDSSWSQYLDAAGYPKSSVLPPSYRQPAAEPMAPLKTAAEAPKPGAEAAAGDTNAAPARRRPAPPPPPKPVDNTNPAGIKF